MVALQELSPEESWTLISNEQVARFAFNGPDGLTVIPVNVRIDDDVLWLRTGAHSAMAASVDDSAVTVLLDRIDPETHHGWSVQVRGRCEAVYDPSAVPQPIRDLAPWADGPKPLWLRLRDAHLTGRVATL